MRFAPVALASLARKVNQSTVMESLLIFLPIPVLIAPRSNPRTPAGAGAFEWRARLALHCSLYEHYVEDVMPLVGSGAASFLSPPDNCISNFLQLYTESEATPRHQGRIPPRPPYSLKQPNASQLDLYPVLRRFTDVGQPSSGSVQHCHSQRDGIQRRSPRTLAVALPLRRLTASDAAGARRRTARTRCCCRGRRCSTSGTPWTAW